MGLIVIREGVLTTLEGEMQKLPQFTKSASLYNIVSSAAVGDILALKFMDVNSRERALRALQPFSTKEAISCTGMDLDFRIEFLDIPEPRESNRFLFEFVKSFAKFVDSAELIDGTN